MVSVWKITYPTNDWFYVKAETFEKAFEIAKTDEFTKNFDRKLKDLLAIEWICDLEN